MMSEMKEVIEAVVNKREEWEAMLSKLMTKGKYLFLPKDRDDSPTSYALPKNSDMPSEVCQSIFVRQCYIDFYEDLKTTSSVTGVLTGRPGMGKSMFWLYYILRKRLEVLADSDQKQAVLLVYVINEDVVKVHIPVGEQKPYTTYATTDNTRAWLQNIKPIGAQNFAVSLYLQPRARGVRNW